MTVTVFPASGLLDVKFTPISLVNGFGYAVTCMPEFCSDGNIFILLITGTGNKLFNLVACHVIG